MKPRTGLLISLSGIDGVGKSTLGQHLQAYLLNTYGLNSRYIWCKFGNHPLLKYQLSRFVKQARPADKSQPTHKGKKPSLMHKAYWNIMLVLHLFQIIAVVRRLLRQGQVVICDRYIYDTIIDLQQEGHLSAERIQRIFDSPLIPKPDQKFLLDLSPACALARKPETGSLNFLEERQALYMETANQYNLTILDASQPVEIIFQTVAGQISTGLQATKGLGAHA